jgi:DUF4097 and DUF4098 domain-containing protein YvlB
MSSPAPTPVPPLPRRRSIAGPVVLILLGLIFLLGTMGVLHWYMLGRLFAHYWPVLIILWGVIKLIEHHRSQREGVRYSGIGAGGVFLLIFLILAGLIATQASRVNWAGLHDNFGWDDGDFSGMFGETFSYTDQITQPFPAGGSLRVVSDRGAVEILPAEGNDMKVVINKKVHADNQQNADKYNEGTKPQVSVADKTITLNANTQGAGEHGVSTDMQIFIPRKAAVSVSSRRGDITINQRDGNLDISGQRGNVTLDQINGDVSLNLDHSSARATSISGDVFVQGRVDDLTLTDITGSASLNGEFMESVRLAHIGKMVSFKSSRTDMEFVKLDGDLDLDSGDLRAKGLVGPGRVITRSKDIRLDAFSGDLRLQDSNGTVEVLVHKMGNLDIDNRNGDIQLSLPVQAAFRIDARARNGEIQSDFGEVKVNKEHDTATATGSVGSGAATVRLNNEHGTIEIRKGSVQALALPEPPKTPKLPKPPKLPEVPQATEN